MLKDSLSGWIPLLYRDVLKFVKDCVGLIGLPKDSLVKYSYQTRSKKKVMFAKDS